MQRAFLRGFLALGAVLTAFLLAPSSASAAAAPPRVLVVHFDADINPVTQDFVNHQIDRAGKGDYSAVVILLDTHGGLVTSMEKIYEKELASKVPVIVYIAPQGAAALSAGVFVAEAADLLAMAPVTNLGSSTPILPTGNLPSDARRKAINHLSAKLRALMSAHGRNAKWADAAVRVASNLTAAEALRMHVVDAVAHDLPALLRQIDGRTTKPNGYVLHTANAELVDVRMGFFARLLNLLIDPNIITLLFLAGIAGIGFEIFHPGAVLPGGLGAVALVTALFGFSVLPISWGGLTLLLLGIVLLVIDAHVTSHGAITVAGLACLAVGAIMLFRNAPTPYHTSVPLVVGITVSLGAFWAIAIGKAVQVRRRPVEVGVHELVGAEGEVRREGLVFVRGELWQASAADGEPLRPGDRVRVEGVDGLRLTVRHVPTAATVS